MPIAWTVAPQVHDKYIYVKIKDLGRFVLDVPLTGGFKQPQNSKGHIRSLRTGTSSKCSTVILPPTANLCISLPGN